MKISKLREDYSKASAKVSELVRQLSFAGIAVIWILRTGEHAGGIKLLESAAAAVGLIRSESCIRPIALHL